MVVIFIFRGNQGAMFFPTQRRVMNVTIDFFNRLNLICVQTETTNYMTQNPISFGYKPMCCLEISCIIHIMIYHRSLSYRIVTYRNIISILCSIILYILLAIDYLYSIYKIYLLQVYLPTTRAPSPLYAIEALHHRRAHDARAAGRGDQAAAHRAALAVDLSHSEVEKRGT
jgi:hypothetical protein